MDTTLDGLLNRRVTFEQPASGYRVAIDTVLLAAAVEAKAGDRVLDLGCGVGGALLCLAARVPHISVTGIDIQEPLVAVCIRNIERNKFQAHMDVVVGDAQKVSVDGFDYVMMNPPYHDEVSHDVSRDKIKRTANTEKDGDLELWIKSASKALKPAGVMALIHRADRLMEIMRYTEPLFGQIEVLSLLPKAGAEPKRVIVRAQKGYEKSVILCRPLVLHKEAGGYTDAADDILRHAKALAFEAT